MSLTREHQQFNFTMFKIIFPPQEFPVFVRGLADYPHGLIDKEDGGALAVCLAVVFSLGWWVGQRPGICRVLRFGANSRMQKSQHQPSTSKKNTLSKKIKS